MMNLTRTKLWNSAKNSTRNDMKKIMFNDKYGLTEAVLSGRKTQTRRIIKLNDVEDYTADIAYAGKTWEAIEKSIIARHAKYKVGELVAVAQSYKDAGYDFCMSQAPYINKMFTKAEYMPHRIRITNVRVERLQDISDDDCIAEGVVEIKHRIPTQAPQFITQYYPCQYLKDCAEKVGWGRVYNTPQQAYAALIDRISGKGTWESNPYVFVYDFELIKS